MNWTFMRRYLIDSWAWAEYLGGTPTGEWVRGIVEGDSELYVHAASLAELGSKAARTGKDPHLGAVVS
jgi:hypothetical protein